MPKLDGTGPKGQGPKTGRGMGNCDGGASVGAGQCGRGTGRGRACRSGNGVGSCRSISNNEPTSL